MGSAEQINSDAAPAAPSFEEFFVAHRQEVYGAIWLVTRDRHEAEEITQEAFVKVLERWEHVASLDDPTGYVVRTAMNVWRSRARRAAVALRKAVHSSSPDDPLERADSQAVVVQALAVLTPRQRAAVVMTVLLGFTSEEAANALGVRPSTVRVLAARGRDRLRERMEEA